MAASKTIMIGVDTSDSSKQALDWTVKNLINKGDTLHVVSCPEEGYFPHQ